MEIWPGNWPPSPQHSSPQHSNELERRLTLLEREQESNGKRVEDAEQKLRLHEAVLWLLGWAALNGKAIDLAPGLAKSLAELLKGF
jgi:hypothetical protein